MKRLASAACHIVFLFLFFCSGQGRAQSPAASFTFSPNQGCAPLNVQFTNTSTGAVSYQWTFGNGNSSTLANPSNIYSLPGNYTVTLTAVSSGGATASVSQQINVISPPS